MLQQVDGHLKSHQQRFYSNPNEPEQSSAWQIPLAIVTPSGVSQVLYTNETSAEFDKMIESLLLSERWVKVNQNTLCLVHYTEDMLQRLGEAVQSRELQPLDRIQLLLDLKRLCNAQRVKPGEVLRFLQFYANEDDWSVLEIVVSVLSNVFPLSLRDS